MRNWNVLRSELHRAATSNKIYVDIELEELNAIETEQLKLREDVLKGDVAAIDELKKTEEKLFQNLLVRYGTKSLCVTYAFFQYTIDFFNALLSSLDSFLPCAEKEKLLRTLLSMHGGVVYKSSIDYFLNPSLSVHAACLTVAKFIAEPEESLIAILFPSVKRIVGIPPTDQTGSFLSFISNELFCFEDFLMSSTGEVLVDIKGIYYYMREKPSRFFDERSNDEEGGYFFVDPVDRPQFRMIAGQAGIDYVDMHEKIYRVQHTEKPSLGYELRKLKDALLLSSKINSGSETIANDAACQMPIRVFYQHWNALHKKDRDKIKNYKAQGATNSLESLLLVLFAYTIGVSDAEFDRVINEKIFVCTHQIGEQLASLISQHPDLNNVPLLEHSEEFHDTTLPKQETIAVLLHAAEGALKTRVVSGCDTRLSLHFSLFTLIGTHLCHLPNQESINLLLRKLEPYIKDFQKISAVLSLLPTAYWNSFFVMYQSDIQKLATSSRKFLSDRISMVEQLPGENNLLGAGFLDDHSLVYLLKSLPSRLWKSLFEVIAKNELTFSFFHADDLGNVLRQFPKCGWQLLREAMDVILIEPVLRTGAGIVNLMMVAGDEWEYMLQLFYPQIQAILNEPAHLVSVFVAIGNWNDLFRFFEPMMKSNINRQLWEFHLFAVLEDELQSQAFEVRQAEDMLLSFFEKFAIFFPNWVFPNSKVFLDFLYLFNRRDWKRICEVAGPSFCKTCLRTNDELQVFLAENVSISARIILLDHLASYIEIKDTLTSKFLDEMLRQYPECEAVLLKIAKPALKALLSEFLVVFALCDEAEESYPVKVLNRFYFLFDKALPVLMSLDYLNVHLKTEEFIRLPELAQRLIDSLEKIDRDFAFNRCGLLDASNKKLRILNDFFNVVINSVKKEDDAVACEFFEKLYERLPILSPLVSLLTKRQEDVGALTDFLKTNTVSVGVTPNVLDQELQEAKASAEALTTLQRQRSGVQPLAQVSQLPGLFFAEGSRQHLLTPPPGGGNLVATNVADSMLPRIESMSSTQDVFDSVSLLREDDVFFDEESEVAMFALL